MLLICVTICFITNTFSKPVHHGDRFSQLKDVSLAVGERQMTDTPDYHTFKRSYDIDCSDTTCEWGKEHPVHTSQDAMHPYSDDHAHPYSDAHAHPYSDDHAHPYPGRGCEAGSLNYVDCIEGHKFPVVLDQQPQHHRIVHSNHFQHEAHHNMQHGTHNDGHHNMQHGTRNEGHHNMPHGTHNEGHHNMPHGIHNEFGRIWNQNTNHDMINNPYHRNHNTSQDTISTSFPNAHSVPYHMFGNHDHGIVDDPYQGHVLDRPVQAGAPKNGTYADVAATLTDVPVTIPTHATHTNANSWLYGQAGPPHEEDILDSLANVNLQVTAPMNAHGNMAPASLVGAVAPHTRIGSTDADVFSSPPNVIATNSITGYEPVNTASSRPLNIAADVGVSPAHTNMGFATDVGVTPAHTNMGLTTDVGVSPALTNLGLTADVGAIPALTNMGLTDADIHASHANAQFPFPFATPSQTTITDADVAPPHPNVAATFPLLSNANTVPIRLANVTSSEVAAPSQAATYNLEPRPAHLPAHVPSNIPSMVPISPRVKTVRIIRPVNAASFDGVLPSNTVLAPTVADTDISTQTNPNINPNVNILCGKTLLTITRRVIQQEGINPLNRAAVLQRFCTPSVPAHLGAVPVPVGANANVGANAGIAPALGNKNGYVINVPIRANVSSANAEPEEAPLSTEQTDADVVAASANVSGPRVDVPQHAESQDADEDDDLSIQGIELSTDASHKRSQ